MLSFLQALKDFLTLLFCSLRAFHERNNCFVFLFVFFLLNSEQQQISSDFQDSSKYSDFNSAEVWIISIFPLTSSSRSRFYRFLGTVQRAPTTIGITITFVFHFFQLYYYFTPLRFFQRSVSRWFLLGVWVTSTLLKSPGLFSVFCPIL